MQRRRLSRSTSNAVNLVVVYVAEAHAADTWPRGTPHPDAPWRSIRQHCSLDERVAAAKALQQETSFDGLLLVDGMDDNFEQSFAVWPERAFVLQDGVFTYISELHEDGSIRWEHELRDLLAQT